jgi:hypothetical protein
MKDSSRRKPRKLPSNDRWPAGMKLVIAGTRREGAIYLAAVAAEDLIQRPMKCTSCSAHSRGR